jgi:carboxymethylenebutenolidase
MLAGLVAAAFLCLVGCGEKADGPAQPAGTPGTGGGSQTGDATADSTAGGSRAEREVVSDQLAYGEVDAGLAYGHFVFPADMVEPLPAVILIHEWWGLDETVRAEADRLAAQGFVVLAVDLFGGVTTTDVQTARGLMLSALDGQAGTAGNLRQAIDFVRHAAGAPAVAVMGWGFGGAWALNSAIQFADDVDASVIYYGRVSDDPERLDAVAGPVLGFFGGADTTVPVAEVKAFETELGALGKEHDVVIYPNTKHGFANPRGRNHNAALAERAWERTLAFLEQTLYSDDS